MLALTLVFICKLSFSGQFYVVVSAGVCQRDESRYDCCSVQLTETRQTFLESFAHLFSTHLHSMGIEHYLSQIVILKLHLCYSVFVSKYKLFN